MRKAPAIVLAMVVLAIVGFSLTSRAATDKTISVTASVVPVTNFTVQLYKATNNVTDFNTDVFPTMAFGTLVNANASDPSSALTSVNGYVASVFVTNNNGAFYHIDFSGAPLMHSDGQTKLSDDAFVVSAGPHHYANNTIATINVAGITSSKRSAGTLSPYAVYTSTPAGDSDSFDMFFGLTGDPNNAVDFDGNGVKDLIPPTQKAGSYSSTLRITLSP